MVENQHRLIKGYRDLSPAEIEAKNEIANLEREVARVWAKMRDVAVNASLSEQQVGHPHSLHETQRQAALARTKFEEAFMHLSRAVLRPVSPWDEFASTPRAVQGNAAIPQSNAVQRGPMPVMAVAETPRDGGNVGGGNVGGGQGA